MISNCGAETQTTLRNSFLHCTQEEMNQLYALSSLLKLLENVGACERTNTSQSGTLPYLRRLCVAHSAAVKEAVDA